MGLIYHLFLNPVPAVNPKLALFEMQAKRAEHYWLPVSHIRTINELPHSKLRGIKSNLTLTSKQASGNKTLLYD